MQQVHGALPCGYRMLADAECAPAMTIMDGDQMGEEEALT